MTIPNYTEKQWKFRQKARINGWFPDDSRIGASKTCASKVGLSLATTILWVTRHRWKSTKSSPENFVKTCETKLTQKKVEYLPK